MEDALILEFQQLKVSVLKKLEKINATINKSNLSSPSKEECRKKVSEDLIVIPKTPDNSPVQGYLKAVEAQRKIGVLNNVQARLKKIEDFAVQQEVNKNKQWLQKQKEFVNDIQQKEDHIFQALEEYDKSSLNNHAQLALYYKNLELRRQQHENEIKNREKEKQILCGYIDKIKKLQHSFRSSYEQILLNLKRCTKIEELKTMLADDFKLLNALRPNFDGIIIKCKNGKISEEDVEKASELFAQLQLLEKKICQSVVQINNKESKVEVEIVKEPPPKPDINVSKYASIANLKIYINLMEFFDKYLQNFKKLETDTSQKQFILDCKRAINIPVNSLSGVNSEHILDKYNKLYKLLKGQDVIISDKRINASSHPEGIPFCLNLLAKRFILQSDLIISSNPESAFCYATVIMSLWNEFPEFGQLMLAYFYKTCPYLVPYYVSRQVGESDEEYYSRQGYQYNNGQIETQDKFLKRMTGVMCLYAAIMVVKPKKGHTNVYNIKNGWNWLAATLKLEPQVDITATLIHTFLETVGFELEMYYGKKFQKLIRIIAEKFLPSCREKCTGGAVTRLELLMTEYYRNRKFEAPDGYLSYYYW